MAFRSADVPGVLILEAMAQLSGVLAFETKVYVLRMAPTIFLAVEKRALRQVVPEIA